MSNPLFALRRRHFRLARNLLANHWAKRRGPRPDGSAGLPVNVHLQPTLACNLACRMCIQNGPAGYLEKGDPLIKASLSVEQWEKILRESAGHGPFVHVWGGEPLLYPGIDRLLGVIRGLDLPVMLTTNAVRGLEHLEALMQLDVLRISVDGPEDIHDEVRGKPGAFQAVIGLIQAVDAERRKRHAFWPRIVTNSLIIDQTYRRLEETCAILAGLPLDRCDLSLPMFTTPERGEAYARLMHQQWGIEARAWKGFCIEGLSVDLDELAATLERIRKKFNPRKFSLFPIGRLAGLRDWYLKPDETFGFGRCHAVTDNVNFLPNGDAVLCNDLPDLTLGNASRQPFAEVWNGERALEFRQKLARGFLPVCSRCCLLYTFPMLKAARRQRGLR